MPSKRLKSFYALKLEADSITETRESYKISIGKSVPKFATLDYDGILNHKIPL